MTNLLIAVVLSGCASTFAIEFIALWATIFFRKENIYTTLTLPLSFGSLFSMGYSNKFLIVGIPSTAFVTLVLNKFVNRPVVASARLPRL